MSKNQEQSLRGIDIIGDIHGELAALSKLGCTLGYDVEHGWGHPENRMPLFLGDLIDLGACGLETAELVSSLAKAGRAACIMGNHEYNLTAYFLRIRGYEQPKSSNRETILAVDQQRSRWEPILDFFRTLPMAYALPDLRIIHACWHTPSLTAISGRLSPQSHACRENAPNRLDAQIALETPFDRCGLKPGLPPPAGPAMTDAPHEILLKGYEAPCGRFIDAYGKERSVKRVLWWLADDARVLRDRPQVFGHYWNLPPVDGRFCPNRDGLADIPMGQRKELDPEIPDCGKAHWSGDTVCVDFNGVTASSNALACAGALRWPEGEVVWATAPRSSTRRR